MEGTMKKLLVVVQVLILLGFSAVVFAAPPPPDSGQKGPCGVQGFHGPMGHGHKFAAILNLTDEQKAKMREMRSRFRADTHDLRYDVLQKRIEMRKLFTDPKVGDGALLAKQKEIGALMQKLWDKKAQMKVEWRKLLTAEQIQKLDMMPLGRGMGHRMGHGGGHEMMEFGGMH